VKLKSAAPERFVSKSVEAEGVSAVLYKLIGIRKNLRIEVSELFPFGITLSWRPLCMD